MKTITFPDGQMVPALGQGTWKFGEGERTRAEEVAALRAGLDLGLTLIDTAEMYGEGGAEEVVGEAMQGRREEVFLVTKVYPHHASRRELPLAWERSRKRLGVETIDLYLLHWRGRVPLAETVSALEALRGEGKIRRWGVSNFDVDDLEELRLLTGDCAANQVLYNPTARGIEYDLLPSCQQSRRPVMAYSPVGQGGELLRHQALLQIAQRHEATAAQIALAWVLRQPGMVAIPKAGSLEHLRANAAAAGINLTAEDLALMDEAFPPPMRKQALEML